MEKSSCEFYLEIHMETRKWVDGDSERSVTQYAANTTKISLGGEYRAFERTFVHMLSRDVKSFIKQIKRSWNNGRQ